MAAPPVCPASCGLRLGAAVPFRPRCDALPPPPAWRPPPAPPSPAGSSPAVSACRRPNPASPRRACLCRKSRPLRNPPPRRPPECEPPRLSIPLAFLHALITHRFMFRRVRPDLRTIKRDMAEFDQPCRLAQLQNLQEQRAERLQMPLAEVADRAKIRRIERHNHHKIVPFPAGLRDPPRRIQPTRIAVQQKRHHHPRVKRRLAEPAHIAARDLLQIKALPHQFNDKPRDMAFRHEIPHIRRQQQRLIDIPGTKILAHSPRLNQTRSELNSDYSDRLLA